ncbi:MAG TPA: S-methyl-5-thioribose-1-phosphate isomerase [Solirubrobacteraceae bacterium]|nr:S-methyl-5-thioribose-1-phosphate isomerase [Solirubrobacteraceae bacterium]
MDTTAMPIVALRFESGALWALDQTALPWQEVELELRTSDAVADAIARLAIRGAPLIGVAAGFGVALGIAADPTEDGADRACATLIAARPTAANLAWAARRVRAAAGSPPSPGAALAEARAIHGQEIAASDAMANHGAGLLASARRLMTHCNTGALAAPGRGSALSVAAEMHARGRLELVIATESRPLLQGARLTVYELGRLGISHELIVDSAAPGLIARGAVDAVIVGCDRVAANGDVANKVGTYGLALAARAARIPFVVIGPTSTVDLECPSGEEIEIEERDPAEILHVGATLMSPPETPCRNPAFDVTPAELVSALVTERGIVRDPRPGSVAALFGPP